MEDDESYDDIELDEDDEGLEISEPVSDNIETSETSHPIITSVTSLRRPSSDSVSPDLSSQKAKKSFKPNQEKPSITISAKQSQAAAPVKRPLETPEKISSEVCKKARLEVTEPSSVEPRPLTKPPATKTVPPPAEKPRAVAASAGSKMLCFCSSSSSPLREAAPDTEPVCQAVENVGGHRVGCRNKVTRLEVVRLTARDSALLCDLHRARLASHGLCPLCGEFCSHGLVFMCRTSRTSSPHLFHRHCYQARPRDERACPHCGSKRSPMAVQLKMSMSRTPLRLLNYTAKMTAGKDKELAAVLDRTTESRENIVNYTLPSGKVICSDGIPKGLEQNRLEEVIKNFSTKSHAKCTTRNMYLPTAAGDNVKLMQLLAMDYSPKQKFPEADGGTPLHVAAGNNHTLTAHILLQAGADIDAFDDNNETPLMIAAYNVSTDVPEI